MSACVFIFRAVYFKVENELGISDIFEILWCFAVFVAYGL